VSNLWSANAGAWDRAGIQCPDGFSVATVFEKHRDWYQLGVRDTRFTPCYQITFSAFIWYISTYPAPPLLEAQYWIACVNLPSEAWTTSSSSLQSKCLKWWSGQTIYILIPWSVLKSARALDVIWWSFCLEVLVAVLCSIRWIITDSWSRQAKYLVQTATSRKEKRTVAVIILCSGSYISKEMWQIFVSGFYSTLYD
jgi:hypothetical protein